MLGILGGLAGVAGALVGRRLDKSAAMDATNASVDATLRSYREAPAAQMEGLANAGLNPMLAYGKLEFPGNFTTAAPGGFTQSLAAMMSAGAAQSQAGAAHRQAGAAESQAVSAAHAAPPNAGTLTITQPILDMVQGRMLHP